MADKTLQGSRRQTPRGAEWRMRWTDEFENPSLLFWHIMQRNQSLLSHLWSLFHESAAKKIGQSRDEDAHRQRGAGGTPSASIGAFEAHMALSNSSSGHGMLFVPIRTRRKISWRNVLRLKSAPCAIIWAHSLSQYCSQALCTFATLGVMAERLRKFSGSAIRDRQLRSVLFWF